MPALSLTNADRATLKFLRLARGLRGYAALGSRRPPTSTVDVDEGSSPEPPAKKAKQPAKPHWAGAPQRYGATRELRSVRSGRFGHQPAASEFCRKCGKYTTVDGLPVVREEALVSAVTEAMYDRMNGHGHHMELPIGYSVGPSDPKAWPFLTAFDDPKVYAMRELHALCEAHFMHPMDDSDALRDVMG
eukprot:jgi/Tetstr1/445436/TSEL_033217.t1